MRVQFMIVFAIGCIQPIRQHGGEPADARTKDASDAADVDASTDAGPLPRTCKDALQRGVVEDGVVMIDPDGAGGNAPFSVYCDMTTASGGWTLVWSYGFTNYGNFTNTNNAITPRPDWGYPSGEGTPESTTTPTGPTLPGAMTFTQWQTLGSEFLVTSNINHWIQCTPGTGSLVTLTGGAISCAVVKIVPNKCTTTAPQQLDITSAGPKLVVTTNTLGNYYFFDGSQTTNWPTHDPCGTNSANQLTGVADPGGAVFVR